jgi:hypothetical protein
MVNLSDIMFDKDLPKFLSISNICLFNQAIKIFRNFAMSEGNNVIQSMYPLKFRYKLGANLPEWSRY